MGTVTQVLSAPLMHFSVRVFCNTVVSDRMYITESMSWDSIHLYSDTDLY